MSRIAEIAVQTSISASKPARGDSRDPNEFSALVEGEEAASAEAALPIAPIAKMADGSEPKSSGQKAVPSLEQLIALLPGVPANTATDAAAAVAIQPTDAPSLDELVAQALAAFNAAPKGTVTPDDTPVSPVAEPDAAMADAASTDAVSIEAQTQAVVSVSATAVAAAVVIPSAVISTVSNILKADSEPQIDLASLGNVAQSQDTGVQADARLATKADAAQAVASADIAVETAPLLPSEANVKSTEAPLAKRVIAGVRREATNAPLATSAAVSVAAEAGEQQTTAVMEPDAAGSAPVPLSREQTPATADELQQAGSQKDGSAKDVLRADAAPAAPAAPSDPKPAIAAPVAASLQAQPAPTPDTPAVAPSALPIQTAAQPALLQAQLIATPAASDAPVPAEGLAIEIAARAKNGKSRFEIRLDPPELGRIDVRLDVDRHGRVTSHLVVEKSETLDMLRRDAPQLERALADSGLKTSDGGMQFSLRDQSFAGRGDQNDRQQGARLMIAEDDIVPATVAGRSYRTSSAAGGLDIRV